MGRGRQGRGRADGAGPARASRRPCDRPTPPTPPPSPSATWPTPRGWPGWRSRVDATEARSDRLAAGHACCTGAAAELLVEVGGVGYRLHGRAGHRRHRRRRRRRGVPPRPPPRPRGRRHALRLRHPRGTGQLRGAARRPRGRPRARPRHPLGPRARRPCARSLADDDLAALCLVPGVGRKTAARLLIELKRRLDVPELDDLGVAVGGRRRRRHRRALRPGRGPRRARRPRLRARRGPRRARRPARRRPRRPGGAAAPGAALAGRGPVRSAGARRAARPRGRHRGRGAPTRSASGPGTLDEFVGQAELKEHLGDPARGRPAAGPGRRPPPVRRPARARQDDAWPASSPTRWASRMHVTSGPAIERAGDLAALLTNLDEGDVLFVDEIHRLSRAVEEVLYPAMEDFQLDIVLGQGPGGPLAAPRPAPLHAGRRHHPHRAHHRAAPRPVRPRRPPRLLRRRRPRAHRRAGRRDPRGRRRPDGAREIARPGPGHAAHRQPPAAPGARLRRGAGRRRRRRARRAPRAWRSSGSTSAASTRSTGPCSGALCERFGGGPVGLKTLAISVGEPDETVEDVYEPFLIQQGLLMRTPKGRVATPAAGPTSAWPSRRRRPGRSRLFRA